MKYRNADQAFDHLYNSIKTHGDIVGNTKVLYNQGFYITNPMDNDIVATYRKWSSKYAEREWNWYLSGDPSAIEISKHAPIWRNHMDESGEVRSNYGWQWNRGSQLDRIIDKLHADKNTRQALLSIYDGKEIGTYQYDTPCTSSIHFQVVDDRLCMTVNMRSNDIWYGFCNDQYCFSKLQELVANELKLQVGWYYHFASNLHLYL
jgi:thymidylate synthase